MSGHDEDLDLPPLEAEGKHAHWVGYRTGCVAEGGGVFPSAAVNSPVPVAVAQTSRMQWVDLTPGAACVNKASPAARSCVQRVAQHSASTPPYNAEEVGRALSQQWRNVLPSRGAAVRSAAAR